MTKKVLVPCGGRWLVLTIESFQKALKQGDELLPEDKPKAQHDDKPIWLPVSAVARLCNVSETYLYAEVRLKRVKARRFGRAWRIHRDFVEHQTSHLDCNDDYDK